MVGRTLGEIRTHIESLAVGDGAYTVVCSRTGQRPIPVADKRFAGRATATAAAKATQQYRATLRRYDPRLPYYDLIAFENPVMGDRDDERWGLSHPVITADTANDPPLISFCHDIAGAVFEALSAHDHKQVETAIMDTYLDAAESIVDRDELCLCLLERMAIALDRSLSDQERTYVLLSAADKLTPANESERPLEATLDHLSARKIVSEYAVSDHTDEKGAQQQAITLYDYVFSRIDGRLPALPLTMEVLRHASVVSPSITHAEDLGGGDWRLTVDPDPAFDTAEIACVPT
jgi:hypothetical protein